MPAPQAKPSIPIDALGLLTRQAGIMVDKEENDFRSPDMAWVGGDKAELENVNFGNYACFMSLGPIDRVRELVQVLAQDYDKAAQTLLALYPTQENVDAAVFYWENDRLGLAMACELHFSDGLVGARNSEGFFPHFNAYAEVLCGYVASDVGWGEMLSEIEGRFNDGAYSASEAKHALDFLYSVTTSVWHENMREAVDEMFGESAVGAEIQAQSVDAATARGQKGKPAARM